MTIIVLDICEKDSHVNKYNNCGGVNFIKKIQKTNSMKIKFISLYPEIPNPTTNKSNTRSCLLKKIDSFQNTKYIVIACHTASSCILDLLINNNNLINNIKIFEPIIPMCIYINQKKYQNILILSTPLTGKIRWHARILQCRVKYMMFDSLHTYIENGDSNNINRTLERLSTHKHFIPICDCVVLGCTHYNIIKNNISNYLKQNNFTGKILDSNYVLYKYLKNKIQ